MLTVCPTRGKKAINANYCHLLQGKNFFLTVEERGKESTGVYTHLFGCAGS